MINWLAGTTVGYWASVVVGALAVWIIGRIIGEARARWDERKRERERSAE